MAGVGKRFEKGHARMGGRAPGTKNKNMMQKEFFRDFIIEKQDEFIEAFEKLDPKDKCNVYLKASEFVMPKISSIKFEGDKVTNSALELLKSRCAY